MSKRPTLNIDHPANNDQPEFPAQLKLLQYCPPTFVQPFEQGWSLYSDLTVQ
jgi:hypothetical protein